MPSEYLSDRPLLKIIREEIRAAGRIPFARYMELCLYHPEYGYYNTARPKLGSAGDFYTNAHLSPVFAQLIARHLVTTWEELSKPRQFLLVELGAGDGAFARTFLDCVAARYPELQAALSYIAVEQGAASRARLMDAIANHDRATAVAALEELPPPAPRPGCIFANEFFDALPLHILSREEGSWREHSICLEGERLAWCKMEPSSPVLAEAAANLLASARGDETEGAVNVAEICPAAARYIDQASRLLTAGEWLIIDYGYTAPEWRAGRFPAGSVLAYRHHRVEYDLLANPGEQDLTAHVNFTALAQAGERNGFASAVPESQSRFLLRVGEKDQFQEIFAGCGETEWQTRARLLKSLILPQGMGETFRVLRMRKGF